MHLWGLWDPSGPHLPLFQFFLPLPEVLSVLWLPWDPWGLSGLLHPLFPYVLLLLPVLWDLWLPWGPLLP